MRTRVDESGCAVSGCTGTGMAVVGWLLITLPVLWVAVALVLWARLSAPARVAAVLVGLAFLLVAWVHVPGKRSALDLLLDGSAAGAMATGIRWGGVGAGLAVVAVFVLTVRAEGPRRSARGPGGPALVAVALLGTLAVALVRTEAPPVTVAEAMPERMFQAAGDTRDHHGELHDRKLGAAQQRRARRRAKHRRSRPGLPALGGEAGGVPVHRAAGGTADRPLGRGRHRSAYALTGCRLTRYRADASSACRRSHSSAGPAWRSTEMCPSSG
ncbi:hypothetical protein [Micromonospora sp. NPDC005299]|uniref:hypothetical protein n=1 Tax=Micromonospora sp. NPDC005299 TaxID=3364231 RepID=UPI003688E6A8